MIFCSAGDLDVGQVFKFAEIGEYFIVYEKEEEYILVGTLLNRRYRKRVPNSQIIFNYDLLPESKYKSKLEKFLS